MHKFLGILVASCLVLSLCGCQKEVKTSTDSNVSIAKSASESSSTSVETEPSSVETMDSGESTSEPEAPEVSIPSASVTENTTPASSSDSVVAGRLYVFQKDSDTDYSVFWTYNISGIEYLMTELWQLSDTGIDLQYTLLGRSDGAAISKAEVTELINKSDLKYPITGGTIDVDTLLLDSTGLVYVTPTPMSKLGLLSFNSYDEFNQSVLSFATSYTYVSGSPLYTQSEAVNSYEPFALNVHNYLEENEGATYTLETGEVVPVMVIKLYFWYPGYLIQEEWCISSREEYGLLAATDALVVADGCDIADIGEVTCGRFNADDWVYNEGGYYEPKVGQGTSLMEPDMMGKSLVDCMNVINNDYAISYTASSANYNAFVRPDGNIIGPSINDIYVRYAGLANKE